MSHDTDQRDHGRLDENLDRLLELGGPPPGMPPEVKARIRSKLTEVRAATARRRTPAKRLAGWSLAAAAALALFIILFWPGGSSGAVSWADVLEQLDRVRTVTALIRSDISDAEGTTALRRGRIWFRDPGCSRSEEYGPSSDDPVSIRIFRSEPGRTEMLTLDPGSDRAEQMIHTLRSAGGEPAQGPVVDFVSESWRRLKRITSAEAAPLGERVIDGAAAAGFEAPAGTFFNDPGGPANEGLLRIWVGRDDAVPRRIELAFEDNMGRRIETVFSEIRWNAPLDDSLFETTVPVDWQLSRTLIDTVDYGEARLAPGVTLQVGPDGGEPLAGVADVLAVARGEVLTRPGSGAPATVLVTLELAPQAARRLRAFQEENPGRLLTADFNEELKVVPHIDGDHPNRIQLNLSLLGLSLAELEERYFTTP